MEEQDAKYQALVSEEGYDIKDVNGIIRSKRKRPSDEGYDEEALADLEQWREDKSNWVENVVIKEEPQPSKKKYTEKDEQATHKEDLKKAFFNDRVEQFKLFLQRRLPPNNQQAQEYYEKFFKTSNTSFANELKTKLNDLSMLGGIDMIFTLMCNKVGMKSTDFVDRSCPERESWPEKKKQEQLTFEILDFHTQLKNLVALAKDLPESYFFEDEEDEELC